MLPAPHSVQVNFQVNYGRVERHLPGVRKLPRLRLHENTLPGL